jgi:hypothetical protein
MTPTTDVREQRVCFRGELVAELRRELIGLEVPFGAPADPPPPAEVLQESPVQRYCAGILFPARLTNDESEDTADGGDSEPAAGASPETLPEEQGDAAEKGKGGGVDDTLGDAYDETVRLANEFFPSAIGLTFIAEVPAKGLVVRPRAAKYESRQPADPEARLREWHRIVLDLKPVVVAVDPAKSCGMDECEVAPNLKVRYLYHRRNDGTWLVTVTLLNAKESPPDSLRSGADCFFQVGFDVRDPEGGFVFREYRSASRSLTDPEEAALELLYRNRRSYAAGHGCAADWGEERGDRTDRVSTAIVPAFKVAPVEPRAAGEDELSMYYLSGAEGKVKEDQILATLENLPRDYEAWIKAREAEVATLPQQLRKAASDNLKECGDCLKRMRAGIDLLRSDKLLREAFLLANRAILMQQYHSRRPRREVDGGWDDFPSSYEPTDPRAGRWRSFQLAFILINLRSLVPIATGRYHDERQLVDLIWFPTGGGKTEAYLGLSACDIFYRRLRDPDDAGCTVLMRYTLRLLTSQQFQRACSMICACELLRREDPYGLGREPISIGLWVGESLTPNRRDDAVKALNALASPKDNENPFQLLKCPWCGTRMDDKKDLGYVAGGKPKTVFFVCPARGEGRCPFAERKTCLPVLVIDEDIYDTPPTLLIGTVDKFAMLAWRAEAGSIFGIPHRNPPDLIIQDELHLISGPLGSVVGLYEGVIDLLCSWKGRAPKIVASTATIRRAGQQCCALYDRPTFQFPPQGTDISDSFFAAENPKAPGRVYAGVFATGAPSFVTATVRTLSALFQGCRTIKLREGAGEGVRDPYWTALQYFNSLRELGHAASLVEADIPEHMWAIASRDRIPKELCRKLGSPVELTSRLSADEIPQVLERLGVSYPRASDDGDRPLDTLLATNMISVGVDVDRLGLMVVLGQPKTTSEYIQASSRVGRSDKGPGLIVAMYNPGKPRDRSHYEHSRGYHSAFYKHVEPTSVTPYSLPVMERALHAVLVIATRHLGGLASPDKIDPKAKVFNDLIEHLKGRCDGSDPDHSVALEQKLRQLLKHWAAVKPEVWGGFGKPPESRPLMYPAGTEPLPDWDDSAWATPSSMRNVDVECQAQVVQSYEDPN